MLFYNILFFSSSYFLCNILLDSLLLLTDFFLERLTATWIFLSLNTAASASSSSCRSSSFPFSFCQLYILLPLFFGQSAPFLTGLSGDFCHVLVGHLRVHLKIKDDEGILRHNSLSSRSIFSATAAYHFSPIPSSTTIYTRICLRLLFYLIRFFNNTSAKSFDRFISLLCIPL